MQTGSIRLVVTRAQSKALARLAKVYRCDVSELAGVALEEMLAAHRPQRPVEVKRARRTVKVTAPRRTTIQTAQPSTPTTIIVPPSAPAKRTFADKPCAACSKAFTPTGPNAKVCPSCRASFAAGDKVTPPLVHATRRNAVPPVELETIWNGVMGREGASLSGR